MEELLSTLLDLGVSLKQSEGTLEVSDPLKNITPPLLEQIKSNKAELISLLSLSEEVNEPQLIPKAPKKEYYKLSSSQRRLHFLYDFDRNSLAYNMPDVIELTGEVNVARLSKAFENLIVRHEGLRTSFEIVEDEIHQKIHNHIDFKITHLEVNELGDGQIIKDFIRPFDLKNAPLIRVGLIRTSEHSHILIVDIHHIVSDGVSGGILIKDFMALYNAENLPDVALKYKDYSEWQQSGEYQARLAGEKEFWLKEFSEDVSILNLPTDYARPSVRNHAGSSVKFNIGMEETAGLRACSRPAEATMFMTILAIYNILLAKLSNQQDITIGTPVAGRGHADLEGVMGAFINTLALRNFPHGKSTFSQFLSEVKTKSLLCFDNQSYQYEELVEALHVTRDTSRNPIFDVFFVFQNFEKEELKIPGLTLNPYDYSHNISKFDLTLRVLESSDTLELKFDYSSELFTEQTIRRFIDYFNSIVTQVVANPDISISAIDILSEMERTKLLSEFNDTARNYTQDVTIGALFSEQMKRAPDKTAIVFEGNKLTFGELESGSNSLAVQLCELSKSSNLVAIYTRPSFEMVIGILGILKSGKGFLPMDPDHQSGRHEEILNDSQCDILVTQEDIKESLSFNGEKVIVNTKSAPHENVNTKSVKTSCENLAYVIYTSGSTGKPKGVKINHRSLINYNTWFTNEADLQTDDKLLLTTSFAFDAIYTQFFGALLNGLELHILAKDNYLSPEKLLQYINDEGISVLKMTPTLFNMVLSDSSYSCELLEKVRCLLLGGEAINVQDVKRVMKSNNTIKLMNHYGPTETTIGSIAQFIEPGVLDHFISRPSIGRPINNTRCYILNRDKELLPMGVAGELCIGGDGVGMGYLGQPELTNERFVEDPFVIGQKIYKTGDLARWMPDGNIEFLGRLDDQVKIRGFRIELGEVENSLASLAQIQETAVSVRNNDGEKYLVGYYTSENELENTVIREHLSACLPDYMIPSFYVHLIQMPLTANGKIDRKSLPDPEHKADDDYIAPSNETEIKLAQIWSEILHIDKSIIGSNKSFFELGGHSLKATLLVNKISKEFDVSIPLRSVFTYQDIRTLSTLIQSSENSEYSSIQKTPNKEHYVLSSAQQRLYFIYEFDKTSLAYNMPKVLELEGDLDRLRFEQTVQSLVARHESLRTSFEMNHEEVTQKINDNVEIIVDYYESIGEDVSSILKEFIRPFDLQQETLFRVGLLKISDRRHLLMVDMHHIITDGTSQGILINDFMSLYNQEQLPQIELQYKDYAEWQQGEDQQTRLSGEKDFWLKEFEEDAVILDLPTDFSRSMIKNQSGYNVEFVLSSKDTTRLKTLSEKSGATMFMTILSIYNVLLSKLTNQQDIVIGSPVAARNHADLEEIIGMFVNTLALRNYPKTDFSFKEFLRQVKEKTLSCFENQSYPFEALIDELNITRDTSRNPLFDVMFVFQNFEQTELSIPGLTLKPYRSDHNITKFDLLLEATEREGQLHLKFEYATDLFAKETIDRFIVYFQRIVSKVIENQDVRLSEIDISSDEERHQLLYEFNNTQLDYSKDKTISELFEEKVSRAPSNIALIHNGETLTYAELNNRANQLAVTLQENGIGANQEVGLMLGRSFDMIIAIMATLKAGGACLPVDANYPEKRINYMLSNSKVKVLLVDTTTLGTSIGGFSGIVLNISEKVYSQETIANPVNENSSTDLLYTIYTSGSTGTPKGVMLKHVNLTNLINYQFTKTKIDFSKVLQFTTLNFDVSFQEIFSTLLFGGELSLVDQDDIKDFDKLLEIASENRIATLFMPASILNQIFNDEYYIDKTPQSIQHIVTAGEQIIIGENFKTYLRKNRVHLHNHYGPSETHVVTSYTVDPTKNIPTKPCIGQPVANTNIYIVDEHNRLQPLGVSGELCISGTGLSKGYVNNDALTQEKFVENIFQKGERMYKTGDLARWMTDGNIEFLGRLDDQIKVRGFRVELGEIESQLAKHPDIKEAAALARERDGEKYLIGYYVSENEIAQTDLRNYLAEQMPAFMVPFYYVHLECLPLTTTGKLDRRALPDPELKVEGNYVPPSNETEETLVEIWAKVLDLEKEIIGINANFFDLGGHSMKILKMNRLVNQKLGCNISVANTFRLAKISAMADFILHGDKQLETIQEELSDREEILDLFSDSVLDMRDDD